MGKGDSWNCRRSIYCAMYHRDILSCTGNFIIEEWLMLQFGKVKIFKTVVFAFILNTNAA